MVRTSHMFTFALVGLSLFGCAVGPASDSTVDANATPEQIVAQFLEAVRTGDDDKAGALLTPLAQRKTAESEMVVAPPGSSTAKFRVEDVEYASGKARVTSYWTDIDASSEPHTDRIVWILRKEAPGWRIAGMAAEVFADLAPIDLNFEDPQDMLRQQQMAEEEIARRERRLHSQQ